MPSWQPLLTCQHFSSCLGSFFLGKAFCHEDDPFAFDLSNGVPVSIWLPFTCWCERGMRKWDDPGKNLTGGFLYSGIPKRFIPFLIPCLSHQPTPPHPHPTPPSKPTPPKPTPPHHPHPTPPPHPPTPTRPPPIPPPHHTTQV